MTYVQGTIYCKKNAAHESGHATFAELLGIPYSSVDIGTIAAPRGMTRAAPVVDRTDPTSVERMAMFLLAGVVAEALILESPDILDTVLGGSEDVVRVRSLLGPRAKDRRLVGRLQDKTLAIAEANIGILRRVGKQLLLQRRLSPGQVRAAFGNMTPVLPALQPSLVL